MSYLGNRVNKAILKEIKFSSSSPYWPARPEDNPDLWELPCAAVVDEVEKNIAKVRYIDPINFSFLCGKTKWLTRSNEQVGDIVNVSFVRKVDRFGEKYYAPMLEEEKYQYDAKRIAEDEEWRRKHGPIEEHQSDDDLDLNEDADD